MDPASATMLFLLFLATEKAVKYAGGKVADSMTKPIWEALEEKAKWLAGKDDTAKRWAAFVVAFEETRKRLETNGRHPELAKQIAGTLNHFDLKTLPDNQWLDNLTIQLEKASLVNQKPDETLLVELFNRSLPKPVSRAELSEVVTDFIGYFKDALFAQKDYQDLLLKIAQWENSTQGKYDTRDRYLAQVIAHNKNLDFVGIPGLKDGQGLDIEDIYISLQTQVGKVPDRLSEDDTNRIMSSNDGEVLNEILGKYNSKVVRTLSVNQALAENSKLVILGDPGSGKTTLLKYIVLAYAQNKTDKLGLSETKIPIFIRMYDYVSKRAEVKGGGFSFLDYLYKYCVEHLALNLPPRFFEDALEKGNCCICLDGLDELGTAGLRREINLAVTAFRSRYPLNRFIVTSRIVGYEEAPLDKNEFIHLTIQPLSDDDIKLFVEKWYLARSSDVVFRRERTKHLIDTIMSSKRIKELATNPLMLTIIALVHRNEAELPNERVQLYEKCVSSLIEKWDAAKLIKSDAKINRRRLERIAYWMHSQPGEKGRTREVREGKLRDKIIDIIQKDPKNNLDEDQILSEAENFINIVKSRSGLLVERGDDIYAFSHLTFQEYLTACDIEKRCSSPDKIWEEIKPKLHDAHWREVILLLLGSLNKQDEHNTILIRNILDNKDEYEPVLHRNLLLAAQALSDHVEIQSKLHDQIVDSLLALLESKDSWIQEMGFNALGGLQNDTRAANGLLVLAEGKTAVAGTRRTAAQALGQLGHKEKAASLLLALSRNVQVDAKERLFAAQALGLLADKDEMVELLMALATDVQVDSYVRNTASQALGPLGYEDEAAQFLIAFAGDKQVDSKIHLNAIKALMQLGRDEEAVRLFLMLAGNEKVDAAVRLNALQALGQLGREEEVAQLLMTLAGDEQVDDYVRSDVALELAKLGRTTEAINLYLSIIEDINVDVFIRSNTAWRLGMTKIRPSDERVFGRLLLIAEDATLPISIRIYAAGALGRLGYNEEATQVLLSFDMEKIDGFDKLALPQEMEKIGLVEEAGKTLLAISKDENNETELRRFALQSLGESKFMGDIALSELFEIASDEKVDAEIRCEAAIALGMKTQTDKVGNLLLEISETNPEVSFQAAQFLGRTLKRVNDAGMLFLRLINDNHATDTIRYLIYGELLKLLA